MRRVVAWFKRVLLSAGIDEPREHILLGAVAMLAGLGLAGLFVLTTGIYSVAASRGHFPWTDLLLQVGMRRSVAFHSNFVPAPPANLSDENLVRLGAAHYFKGCAFCHGAPGKIESPVTRGMLPPPPDLAGQVAKWSDKELFWLVHNGLKYTGMPGWPALSRGDEVWPVIAFLRRLPNMSEAEYLRLAHGSTQPQRPQDVATSSFQRIVADCARCHGDKSIAPSSNLVPGLSGQKEEYLALALENYANGKRPSGIMEPLAAELDADLRKRIARYFAQQPTPKVMSNKQSPPDAKGEAIALNGIPERGIPACTSCHSANSAATFPRLSTLSAHYLERQLKNYKGGLHDATAHGAIMSAIAKRLSDEEIAVISRYFEQRDPRDDTRAERSK